MNKKSLNIEYLEYDSLAVMNNEDKSLLKEADDNLKNAYAPYSNFKVSAVCQLEDGTTVKGTNQENGAYPSGLCAERVAIFAAKSQFPNKKVEKIDPLFFDYPIEMGVFCKPITNVEKFKSLFVAHLSTNIKCTCIHEMLKVTNLRFAPWKDKLFVEQMTSGELFKDRHIYYAGIGKYPDLNQIDCWRVIKLPGPSGGIGAFKLSIQQRLPLIVTISDTDKDNLDSLHQKCSNLLFSDYKSRTTKVIDELLPKHENDWHQKIRPVDSLWENQFGIKGMAGSQKEWVWDKYYQDNQFFGPRTLRGESLRSRARGPEPLDMKYLNRDWSEPLSYFVRFTKDPKEEMLSSMRNSNQPHIRKTWYGFRPVIASKKKKYPTELADCSNLKKKESHIFLNPQPKRFRSLADKNLLWSVYEVRNANYLKFNPSWSYGKKEADMASGYWLQDPARNMSWNEAQAFCAWLTKKEQKSGVITSAQHYRLPTYAEWKELKKVEPDAPIFNKGRQWSGNFADSSNSIYKKVAYHAYGSDGFISTAPVGEWVTDKNLNNQKSKRYADTNYTHNGNAGDFNGRIVSSADYKRENIGFRLILVTPSSNK